MGENISQAEKIVRLAEMGEITLAVASLYEYLGGDSELADTIKEYLESGDYASAREFLR